MHKTRRAALAAAVALMLVTSCSGGDDDTAGAEPAVANDPEPERTTTSTTEPATTTTTTPGLGAVQNNEGATATALAYEQPVAPDAPSPAESELPDSYVWSALDVEVCVPSSPGEWYVGNYIWKLTMPDNSIVEPSSVTYLGFPQPEYPVEQAVSPGQCVRGWITFAVPGDSRPTGVQYSPDGALLRWSIPA